MWWRGYATKWLNEPLTSAILWPAIVASRIGERPLDPKKTITLIESLAKVSLYKGLSLDQAIQYVVQRLQGY